MNVVKAEEAWDIKTEGDVTEESGILETATPEELRGDVTALFEVLQKIAALDPSRIGSNSPSNKNFGKKIILALERAKSLAANAAYEQHLRDMVREQRFHEQEQENQEPDGN